MQRDALLAAGVDARHLFEDHASGAKDDGAGLAQALEFVRPGDVVVVWKHDRLGRSLLHLLAIVTSLKDKHVAFRSLTEGMDTTTPSGELLFHSERVNIDQIVATLCLKEMTQGTLIRKLCTYTAPNPTRRAIFEFDKLVRSIYTLRYLRDPQLERNMHRSQNRIESYHQLRSAIAQVGGKKELTGRTDIEIGNQCARLIANAIIYYNLAILSRLLTKYEAGGNANVLALITQISPAAWRHILLNGHYTFQSDGKMIDLDALVAGLELG